LSFEFFSLDMKAGPLMSAIRILPFEKRTAFDATGKPVEGKLPEGLCVRYGLKEGALLLLNGVEGRASGFGLEHIQANTGRMKQLSGLGFTSAHMFVRYVFENYTAVSQQPDGRIVLVAERNADYLWVVCLWDPDRLVWSVTTAIPKRHKRGLTFIWTAGQESQTA
jgi:hypothetical protein